MQESFGLSTSRWNIYEHKHFRYNAADLLRSVRGRGREAYPKAGVSYGEHSHWPARKQRLGSTRASATFNFASPLRPSIMAESHDAGIIPLQGRWIGMKLVALEGTLT